MHVCTSLCLCGRAWAEGVQGARTELTEDQKQELKEAFELFDTENSGKLGYHELKVRCRLHVFSIRGADGAGSRQRVHVLRRRRRCCCDVQVAMRALGFEVTKEEVRKLMQEYDREETGSISFDDFMEISTCMRGRAHVCARACARTTLPTLRAHLSPSANASLASRP